MAEPSVTLQGSLDFARDDKLVKITATRKCPILFVAQNRQRKGGSQPAMVAREN